MKADTIAAWVFGVAGAAYGLAERRGKQRAIREKNKYQERAEAEDGYRSSSGLTPEGTTPEEVQAEGG